MSIQTPQKNIPTILVILGATGDLTKKKILPSLYHLHINNRLPDRFRVIGMARKKLSDETFRSAVRQDIATQLPKAKKRSIAEVSNYFSYSQGEFQNVTAFTRLKKTLEQIDADWGVCTNKLFYLAVPPAHFGAIFTHMAAVGLNSACGGELGWTRVLVEKPFGHDAQSARALFALLNRFFQEKQLYLIDHYLAKEIVQAIPHFRFSNNLFETSWNKQSIERIHIRLLETIGAEDRGAFYDPVGAFRDVGQNHLLQMLAAITMENPTTLTPERLRDRRADILDTLRPWSASEIKTDTFRSQYSGYTKIKDVSNTSTTETYFKLKTELSHPSWRGVPIILEAGKSMGEAKKDVEIVFRHPPLCVACPPDRHIHNTVVFTLSPDDRITIHFWTKVPGFEKKLEERAFTFFLYEHKQPTQYVEEYAELLFNAFMGDQSMFVSQREVEAQWKFADPVVRAWKKNAIPLHSYRAKTQEAVEAAIHIGRDHHAESGTHKQMAIVGLGKMGSNMARRMMDQGWHIVGYNKTAEATDLLAQEGMTPAYSLEEMLDKLPKKKIIWLMVPAGKPVDEVLFGKQGLVRLLKRGDIIIDGGNSFYKDTIKRAKKLHTHGIRFLDAGTSGGPSGARSGACLMIGGTRQDFQSVEHLFRDFATQDGYQFFQGHGAGHFVKMVHNGIEYGMMQAIAEGFALLKKATFRLDLTRIADVYNHGSVVESRLIGWLQNAFTLYGEALRPISGSVQHLGEGAWTVQTAKEMKVKISIIEAALQFRYESEKNPSYTGQIVSALRGQFGGHPVLKK